MRKDDTDSYGADQIDEEDPFAQPEDTAPATTAPADDPTGINSNPYGPEGSTAPWAAGEDHPQSDYYPGWHWDANMGRYMKDQDQTPDEVIPTETNVDTTPAATTPAATTKAATGAAATIPAAVPSGGLPVPTATATTATVPRVSTATNPNQAFNDSIRKNLLDAIGKSSRDVSPDDPEVAPAILANKVTNERSLEQERNDIAERLGTQGLSGSGALDTQMQAARERAGSSEGTFAGNALMTEAQGRRSELVALLGQSAGVLNADEQRQLQGKIADLDAFLRQEGITNQNTQYYDQLGLSAAEFQALLNRQAVVDALGG